MKKLLSPTLMKVSALLLSVFCLPGTIYLSVSAASQSDPCTPISSQSDPLPDPTPPVSSGDIIKTGFQEAGIEAKSADVHVNGNVLSEEGYGIYSADSTVEVTGNVRGDDIGVFVTDETRGSYVNVTGDVEGGLAGVSVSREGQDPLVEFPETCIEVEGSVTGNGRFNHSRWNLPVESAGVIAEVEGYFGLDVTGDVKSMTPNGSGIYLRMNREKAAADIRVDGTVAGAKSGITVYYPTDAAEADLSYDKPRLTVFEIERARDGYVTVEGRSGDFTPIAEQILSNIDYIIRSEPVQNGSIQINATLKHDTLVGREGEEIKITITPDEGYYVDSVDGGKAQIRLNDDGTYTLLVPQGGGVDVTAVLKAIEEGASEVSVAAAPVLAAPDTPQTEEQAVEVAAEQTQIAPVEKNMEIHETKTEVPAVIAVSTPDTVPEDEVTQEESATVLGIRRSARTGDRTLVWQMIFLGMGAGMYLAAQKIRSKDS